MFANEGLMVSHLTSFIFLALAFSLQDITALVLNSRTFSEVVIDQLWLVYVAVILCYFEILGCLTVVGTMMIMFIKHSRTLTDSQQRHIARQFLLVFTKTEDLAEINAERIK